MKPVFRFLLVLSLAWLPRPVWADVAPVPLDTLISQLESSYPRVRLKAVQSLGRAGAAAREAVPALGKALRDLDEDVREAASRALARIGPAAVPVLIDELNKHAPRVPCDGQHLSCWL